jgi:transposase
MWWAASSACSPGTWLADLGEDEGIPVVLGHALYMRAIPGGTAKNDRLDAPKIVALLRGGLMPHADVYPRRMRATRDLLRRRNHRRHQRAEVYAHIQHTASQYHLSDPWGRIATPQNRRGLLERFDHRGGQQNMAVDVALVDVDDPLLAALARDIEKIAHGHDPVSLALVRTMPGVGNILALVMLDEIAQITRFPRVQAFVSSCRLGKSAKESKGKRYGTNGKKLGNAHLTWAVSEAAVRFRTNNEPAQQYLATLTTRHGKGKALAILAHKLGRAVYFMRKQPVAVDQEKCLAT